MHGVMSVHGLDMECEEYDELTKKVNTNSSFISLKWKKKSNNPYLQLVAVHNHCVLLST